MLGFFLFVHLCGVQYIKCYHPLDRAKKNGSNVLKRRENKPFKFFIFFSIFAYSLNMCVNVKGKAKNSCVNLYIRYMCVSNKNP